MCDRSNKSYIITYFDITTYIYIIITYFDIICIFSTRLWWQKYVRLINKKWRWSVGKAAD